MQGGEEEGIIKRVSSRDDGGDKEDREREGWGEGHQSLSQLYHGINLPAPHRRR